MQEFFLIQSCNWNFIEIKGEKGFIKVVFEGFHSYEVLKLRCSTLLAFHSSMKRNSNGYNGFSLHFNQVLKSQNNHSHKMLSRWISSSPRGTTSPVCLVYVSLSAQP